MSEKLHTPSGEVDPENNNNPTEILSDMDDFATHMEKTENEPQCESNLFSEIIRDSKINWSGMSEEEANTYANSLDLNDETLHADSRGSIESGLVAIVENLRKNGEDLSLEDLEQSVFHGTKDDEVIKNLSEKLEKIDDKNDLILDVLSSIHNGWIDRNEPKFFNPDRKNRQYQFMPLELIGFKEAKSDLLFVAPILEAAGVETPSDEDLEASYKERTEKFLTENGLETKEQLESFIASGANLAVLDKHPEIKAELPQSSSDIAEQISEKISKDF